MPSSPCAEPSRGSGERQLEGAEKDGRIAAGSTALTADAWGRLPRTFVYCDDDYATK